MHELILTENVIPGGILAVLMLGFVKLVFGVLCYLLQCAIRLLQCVMSLPRRVKSLWQRLVRYCLCWQIMPCFRRKPFSVKACSHEIVLTLMNFSLA